MWSRYNHFFSKENRYFLYNSLSNGFIELDNLMFDSLYESFRAGTSPNNIDGEIADLLRKMKAIEVDDDFENNKIEYINNARCFSNTRLQLTINPTLGCNFACPYCFEGEHKVINMSEQTEDNIVSFVRNHKTAKNLEVTWFGGEPLMAFHIIERLTHKLISLGLRYDASMISNGYLLNRNIISKLEALRIHSIQITLDGPKQLHDSRRHLIGGGATFDKIIANIKLCQELSPNTRIIVRVNIDRTNRDQFPVLFNHITSLDLPNTVISPAFVTDCAAEEPNPNVLSDSEKAEYVKWLYHTHNLNFDFFFPSHGRAGCSVRNLNTMVIGPKGELYRCWEDVGNEDRVYGNICGQVTNPTLLMRYVNASNQFKDQKCKDCLLLPVCAGGCPKHRMLNIYEGRNIDVCPLIKHDLDDFLYLHFLHKTNPTKS